jgi:mRNA-degrading endonuclease toxin of MazEF toxin-antitoxin module
VNVNCYANITSLKVDDKVFSFQVFIQLKKESVILVDQIQTIDRNKFKDKITEVSSELMEEIKKKIHFVLALKN